MKTKHTRGKWKVESCNVRTTIVSDENPVCNLFNLGEETEANAKLIAASPELLEALKSLLHCPDLNFDELESETREAIDKAANAIAKATNQNTN